MKKNCCIFYFPSLLIILFASCDKVDVTFTDNVTGNDPNITYHEDYKADVATYMPDSFITSGSSAFMLGTHTDSMFGRMSVNSYSEIQIPSSNPVMDKDVLFDSLKLILTANGNYYGDTNLLFKVSVHQLSENIENKDESSGNTSFYYPRIFGYDPLPIGQSITYVQPNRKKEIGIRLSDAIGRDWLAKFKNNATEIQSQDNFRNYFKGVCIATDSSFNNTVYYLTALDTTILIRLYYTERGATFVEKTLDFSYPVARQFNNIRYNFKGTPFASFIPYKAQAISSNALNNKAYVSNNIPSYAKITFPDLLSLKELYPYVKIIRAELEIKPSPGTYGYPYRLPPALQIYVSNGNNEVSGYLTDIAGASQNGNLSIDELYGEGTRYTFDVTDFANTVFNEGRFSTKAIFIAPASELNYNETARLVFNDQQSRNGIKLKLYVLGL